MTYRILGSHNHVLASDARYARGPRARARGLLGRRRLQPGEALILPGARQVHTFGMTYPIDVVYCDGSGRVLQVDTMRPNRIGRFVWKARCAIEVTAGAACVEPGEELFVTPR